jgi:hypothetical protein
MSNEDEIRGLPQSRIYGGYSSLLSHNDSVKVGRKNARRLVRAERNA